MYDLNKRSYFTTLGELRLLLANYPDDTRIYACGADDAYLHFDDSGMFVSVDYDALDSDYEDELAADVAPFSNFWEEQAALMMAEHDARLAVLTSAEGE